jgi:hypothetical protein
MTTKGRLISVLAATVALAAGAPVAASATPLLSGYGGPGQGSQAILGARLLNGPGGGGSSGAAGGGEGSSGSEASLVVAPQASSGRGHNVSKRSGSRARGTGASGAAHNTAPGGFEPVFTGYTASERAGVARPLLGISGEDDLYIVLALSVLAFTGILTGRVAGASRRARMERSSDGA